MINKLKITRILSFGIALAGFTLAAGELTEANAQTRDPFLKPGYARTRPAGTGTTGTGAKPTEAWGVPSIEQRIEYYKRLREEAATNGAPLPKVTSVLTLNEMAVTGIFQTPRGYAAMVEATPIKLSYTIYPGEKFFDGQLVAVEENRLVFRRVTKVGKGKFVSTVEHKPLRQYTTTQQIQGTAPVQASAPQQAEPQAPAAAPAQTAAAVPAGPIVSPLDEMNSQDGPSKESTATKGKPSKVARKQ